MAIDPVMLALCKGEAGATATGVPVVVIDTPINVSENPNQYAYTDLSKKESVALRAVADSVIPPVLVFANIPICDGALCVFTVNANGRLSASLVENGGYVIIGTDNVPNNTTGLVRVYFGMFTFSGE